MLLSFNKSGLMVLRLCWRSYGKMARFKRPLVIPDCELQAIFGQELKLVTEKISMRPCRQLYHK